MAERRDGVSAVHLVSVSGGKDSTATYCRAVERGRPFRAVFADTGNEHPATYEAVKLLAQRTGGPEVEWVRADFADRIAGKRAFIEKHWASRGVLQANIDRALAVLRPTGNPYLDLCLWKGRFPSRKAQFCTIELKVEPIHQQIVAPLLDDGRTIISWQGVRRAESFERSLLPRFQRMNAETVRGAPTKGRYIIYRPLIDIADVDEVFDIAKRHGVPPNPLYGWGCSRVGCFPCINSSKAEIALIEAHFPDQIERLEAWEALVSDASKRGMGTFFTIMNDPVMAAEWEYEMALGQTPNVTQASHGIRRMVEWAKTDRGGRQANLFYQPENTVCHTHGACE